MTVCRTSAYSKILAMEEDDLQPAAAQSEEESESHGEESEEQDLEDAASKENSIRRKLNKKLQKLKDAYAKKGIVCCCLDAMQLLSHKSIYLTHSKNIFLTYRHSVHQ